MDKDYVSVHNRNHCADSILYLKHKVAVAFSATNVVPHELHIAF